MSSPTFISVTNFRTYLAERPDPYKDCDAVSISHCKDMNSKVLHEYLHLIIRHRPSHSWRRLVIERLRDQDQVIIGRWPWVGKLGDGGCNDQTYLPLIMRTLRLESVKLHVIAHVLLTVHRHAPKYNLAFANCFWYANAVFEILKRESGGKVTNWPYNGLRYQFWVFNFTVNNLPCQTSLGLLMFVWIVNRRSG